MPLFALRRRAALVAAAAAAFLAACSPLKVVDRLTPRDTYTADTGIAYGSEPRQQLDVYRPLASVAPAEGKRPLIVFFYGGTWTTGERASFRFVGEALAASGAVVVIPDYRLSPQVSYPAFVRDSAKAMKWGLDNAARLGADPQRVYVMGHSSGAYNAAMVALDPRWLGEVGASPKQLAGWIGLAGPYDFLPMGDPDAQRAFDWPDTKPESQPIHHVSAAAPRTLLLAATKDTLVDPVRNTGQMARKLRAAGVDVTVQTFDNLSHVTLIGAVATPIRWIGGPVVPPILAFLGLPSDPSHKAAQ
jgi:acetyl esterase/lipase